MDAMGPIRALYLLGIAVAGTVQAETGRAALEEVVVTARRIEEQLADVPLSVSVIGGLRLDEFAVTRWERRQFKIFPPLSEDYHKQSASAIPFCAPGPDPVGRLRPRPRCPSHCRADHRAQLHPERCRPLLRPSLSSLAPLRHRPTAAVCGSPRARAPSSTTPP